MMVNGRMICLMDKAPILGQMGENTLVNSKMVKDMAMAQ